MLYSFYTINLTISQAIYCDSHQLSITLLVHFGNKSVYIISCFCYMFIILRQIYHFLFDLLSKIDYNSIKQYKTE